MQYLDSSQLGNIWPSGQVTHVDPATKSSNVFEFAKLVKIDKINMLAMTVNTIRSAMLFTAMHNITGVNSKETTRSNNTTLDIRVIRVPE